MSKSRLAAVDFPVKLNDRYTCQGVDARGQPVVFDDLLSEGDLVASFDDGEGNRFGPFATVVRRTDGLWVELAAPAARITVWCQGGIADGFRYAADGEPPDRILIVEDPFPAGGGRFRQVICGGENAVAYERQRAVEQIDGEWIYYPTGDT